MRHLRLAIAIAAALSCTKDQSPLGRDYYALQSVAGIALPAPYAQSTIYNGLLVADSIAFRADNTGLRHWVYQDENSTERHTVDTDFTWTRSGNDLTITFVCPPLALCIAGPHLVGTIDEVSIVITDSKVTRQPLIYQRSGIERLEGRSGR
jgi:hypothetical protein